MEEKLKMYTPEIVQSYLDYLKTNKNKSDNTIESYGADLRMFCKYMVKYKIPRYNNKCIDDIVLKVRDRELITTDFIKSITLEDLDGYVKYLNKERNNSPNTITRKIVSLQGLYKYLHNRRKIIPFDIASELEPPKIPEREYNYLTKEQCFELLKTIKEANHTFAKRDYAIIVVFLNTGLRISELESLNIDVINQDTIIGKGNKERGMSLNNSCVVAIQDYLQVRPDDCIIDKIGNPLFVSERKERLKKGGISGMLEKYIAMLGYEGITIHKLRHSFCMLMLDAEIDIFTLQKLLGHSNLNTTQRYLHITKKKINEAVNTINIG